MPHPIPLPVRQVIVQRAEQGQSAGLIARCLGLVPRSVRQLLQRLRMQGQNALVSSYPSQPYPHSAQFRTLVEEALQLRREHPTWGAGLVRVLLRRHYPAVPIPAERTLQRWFRRVGLIPAPAVPIRAKSQIRGDCRATGVGHTKNNTQQSARINRPRTVSNLTADIVCLRSDRIDRIPKIVFGPIG